MFLLGALYEYEYAQNPELYMGLTCWRSIHNTI